MGFIVIDYDTLLLVAVFAFAAIGLSRGWLTEFINTVLLLLLSILLVKPEMLAPVLEKLNELGKLLLAMLKSGLDLGEAFTIFKDMDDIIDPSNPYPLLLFLTIALLAMQYAGTRIRLTGELTPFSRILWGCPGRRQRQQCHLAGKAIDSGARRRADKHSLSSQPEGNDQRAGGRGICCCRHCECTSARCPSAGTWGDYIGLRKCPR